MQFDLSEAIFLLSRTPVVLRTLLGDLPEPWVRGDYGEATFSPFDVVGHLICGERRDWMPRLRTCLEHGAARTFEPFDRYAMFDENRGRSMDELLDEFATLRAENLSELSSTSLSGTDLTTRGRHPEFGAVTVEQLLATWVVHDLNHVAQIAKAMAYQYADAVGPWKAYLSILKPPNPAG